MSEPAGPPAGNGSLQANGEVGGVAWAMRSDAGAVRPHNEDWAGAWLPDPGQGAGERAPLFVLCDGLGGHAAGEVASRTAVDAAVRSWSQRTGRAPQALRSAAAAANIAVFDTAAAAGRRGMATTLTALAVAGGQVLVAHVGDSRCYQIRAGSCTQLTADHSRVGELLRHGLISPEQAAKHPARSQLTRAVGTDPIVQVDLVRVAARPGDVFVLCSDGLWDLVARHELIDAAAAALPGGDRALAQVASDLVLLALSRTAPDNVTVVLVQVVASPAEVSGTGRPSFFRRGGR
jgi:PPM family protein phosphatase